MEDQRQHESSEEETAEQAIISRPVNNKKKKKKKKTAASPAAAMAPSVSGKKGKATVDDGMDEIDRTLKELNEKFGELPTAPVEAKASAASSTKSLLSVDARALDSDAEMRKMFGSKVVNDEIRRKRYIRSGKRTALAAPREHWPQIQKLGLTMEPCVDSGEDGLSHFKFLHSRQYQEIQHAFIQCINTHDPNTIEQLLRMYPYHIDSLLTLSEIAKHGGDITMAAELVERALYAFERSFHSLFNISSGTSRLSYQYFENRAFHLGIFRHLGYLARRGCWRTAFEFAKLLLSVDPEDDPLGTLWSIDFYAINAKETDWYIRLYEANAVRWSLAEQPNHAYSIALAKWEAEVLHKKDHTESSKLLQTAVRKFPSTIPQLYEKCGISSGDLASRPFFQDNSHSAPLTLQIQLYIERNHALWKVPEVLAWLRENVGSVVLDGLPNEAPSSKNDSVIPRNLSRHIFISDFASITSALPAEITSSGIQAHDPLPPVDAPLSPYSEYERTAATSSNSSLLGMLQQLLPWVNGGNGAPGRQPDVEDIRDLADMADAVLNPPNDLINAGRDEQVAANLAALQESLPGLMRPEEGGAAGNQDWMTGIRDTFSRLGLFSGWAGGVPPDTTSGEVEGEDGEGDLDDDAEYHTDDQGSAAGDEHEHQGPHM
ncbi:Transcription factor 25 [Thoreauomyces humboldtii]|nr:Transcription factor 25 [Thoreauomyces humboldtii]